MVLYGSCQQAVINMELNMQEWHQTGKVYQMVLYGSCQQAVINMALNM